MKESDKQTTNGIIKNWQKIAGKKTSELRESLFIYLERLRRRNDSS
jgi:hypothetical protein